MSLMWSAFGPRDKVEYARAFGRVELSLTLSTLEPRDKICHEPPFGIGKLSLGHDRKLLKDKKSESKPKRRRGLSLYVYECLPRDNSAAISGT